MLKAQSRTARSVFTFLAALGVAIWLLAVGLHVAGVFSGHTYEIDHTVLLVGGILGFVGFYGLDPKRARDAGAFIVDQGVKMGKVLPRFGRRQSDAVAIPGVQTTTTAVPTGDEKDENIERPRFAPGGA